jgi:short subunit dehydrogenase-like uncharacterized protein
MPTGHDGGVTDHDVVVFGATGFVGTLLAAYLAEHAPPDLRVALAGRSPAKLESVRAGLPAAGRGWPLLAADSGDPASLAALAGSTRVLITTVGPYARYGLPVVEACARAGTHYADLTGEVLFVRDAIDRYHELARGSGTRIVHSCGYDSIPSDLATLLLAERAAADGAGGLTDVRLVAYARGGFSGGTVDSMRGHIDEMRDPARRRAATDPYALSPDRAAEPATRQPRDGTKPTRTPSGVWIAPFVMAPYNTRVVRRSNALQDWRYGRSMAYGEAMACGRGPVGAATAYGVTAGLVAFVSAMNLRPTRAVLDRVLPPPGSGPGETARTKGFFRMVVDAGTEAGSRYRAVAAGPGDPGYAATAVMLGQSTLSLALDELPDRAGCLTPATAFGTVLVDRLRAAGHTYEVTARA